MRMMASRPIYVGSMNAQSVMAVYGGRTSSGETMTTEETAMRLIWNPAQLPRQMPMASVARCSTARKPIS